MSLTGVCWEPSLLQHLARKNVAKNEMQHEVATAQHPGHRGNTTTGKACAASTSTVLTIALLSTCFLPAYAEPISLVSRQSCKNLGRGSLFGRRQKFCSRSRRKKMKHELGYAAEKCNALSVDVLLMWRQKIVFFLARLPWFSRTDSPSQVHASSRPDSTTRSSTRSRLSSEIGSPNSNVAEKRTTFGRVEIGCRRDRGHVAHHHLLLD